jgi:hypothetical protein
MKKIKKDLNIPDLFCHHTFQHLYWVCDNCKTVFKQVTETDLALCGYIKATDKQIHNHIKAENIKEVIKTKKPKYKLPETKTVIRRKSGLMEWVCEHGVGHPLLASAIKIANKHKHILSTWLTHGCDGCCKSEEFKKINKEYTLLGSKHDERLNKLKRKK